MKELPESINIKLPPVKLHLDDIEKILEILSNKCESIEIRTDRYYDMHSIDDLKGLEDDILHYLYIQTENPIITIIIGKEGLFDPHVNIKSDFSTVDTDLITESIEKILKKRVRVFMTLTDYWYIFIIFPIIYFLIYFSKLIVSTVLFNILNLFCLVGSIVTITHILYSEKKTLIILKTRREAPGFLKRNWENIIIGLGCTLFGIVIGHYFW